MDNYSDLPEMKFDRGFTGHEHLEMPGCLVLVLVHLRGGNIKSALSMYMTASKLNYWNTYSEKYVIPKILKALW